MRIGTSTLAAVSLALAAGAANAQTTARPAAAPKPVPASHAGSPAKAEPKAKPAGSPPADFVLHLLHVNDGESQLVGVNTNPANPPVPPEQDLFNYGGAARMKTLADNLRAFAETFPGGKTASGAILVSSGDNILPGPEFTASLEAGVPFYDSIALEAIGLDAITLGNHEFDLGPDVLRQFIEGFSSTTPFISANLDFTNEPGLGGLQNVVRSTLLSVDGRLIGVVGATTPTLASISTPRFTIVNPLLPVVQQEVDALAAKGAKIIILSTHLQGLSSEFELISQLDGVDIVVGGGGSELLANPGDLLIPGDVRWPTSLGGTGYPRIGTDINGTPVPVVTTDGDYKYIGRLVASFDADGNLLQVDPISGPVRVSGVGADAVAEDPGVFAQVTQPVRAAVNALAAQVLAISQESLDGRRNSVRGFETNLSNLLADALLYTATVRAEQFGVPRPDVAIQNGGGIRIDRVLAPGFFTALNSFETAPFPNFVSVVEGVTPQRFKEVLENAVSRVGLSGNGRFAQVAGFTFTWDAARTAQVQVGDLITTPGQRVRSVVLDDGRVIVRDGEVQADAGTVTLATIDFLARAQEGRLIVGGDDYRLGDLPLTNMGVTQQQAIAEYLSDWLAGLISTNQYPASGEGRIIRLN